MQPTCVAGVETGGGRGKKGKEQTAHPMAMSR